MLDICQSMGLLTGDACSVSPLISCFPISTVPLIQICTSFSCVLYYSVYTYLYLRRRGLLSRLSSLHPSLYLISVTTCLQLLRSAAHAANVFNSQRVISAFPVNCLASAITTVCNVSMYRLYIYGRCLWCSNTHKPFPAGVRDAEISFQFTFWLGDGLCELWLAFS